MDPNDESVAFLLMIEDLQKRLNEKDLVIKKLTKMVLDLAKQNDVQRKQIEEMEKVNG